MLRGRQPAPLTEAARDVLEEVVAGLRDEILASAWRSAAEPYGEAREIAVNDILRAVDEMRRPPSRLRSPVERLLLFYALTGILTAIAGLVYLVAVRFLPNLSGGQLVAALATLAGTAIGAVSSLLAATRTRRGRGVSEWHAPEPTSPREFGSVPLGDATASDRKSTRLNSSHSQISYAVFCLKKKKNKTNLKHCLLLITFKSHF